MKLGEKMSEEMKLRVSQNRKGKCIGNQNAKGHIPNSTSFKKGQMAWNKGMKRSWFSPTEIRVGQHISPATEFKIGENLGDKHPNWKGGKPKCSDCGIQLSSYKGKKCSICFNKRSLEKSPRWIGGSTKSLRKIAFMRDNYTCQVCGVTDKEVLTVDHIKPRSKFPELSLVLENLITLCANCHLKKTKRNREFSRI